MNGNLDQHVGRGTIDRRRETNARQLDRVERRLKATSTINLRRTDHQRCRHPMVNVVQVRHYEDWELKDPYHHLRVVVEAHSSKVRHYEHLELKDPYHHRRIVVRANFSQARHYEN